MKSIVLVGLPGAGKTTIGRKLARHLGRKFYDTDQLLEKRLGASIADIFDATGERHFRQRECELLSELLIGDIEGVVAAGGGIVKCPANRALITSHAIGVHVRARPSQVWKRLRHDTKRPLLQVQDPLAVLERLHAEREELYGEVATLTIDAFSLPLASLVADLALVLRRLDHEPFGREKSSSGASANRIKSA